MHSFVRCVNLFNKTIRDDGFIKSRRKLILVIPTKVGIQYFRSLKILLDPGFRRETDTFSDKVLAILRQEFGGHEVQSSEFRIRNEL